MKAISKSQGLILMMLINLGLISDVKCDCTNGNGVVCTGTDCCYDGPNGIPPILGDPGTITPVQDCYTPDATQNEVTFTCDNDGDLEGPPFNNCNNGAWDFQFGPTCEGITSCPQPRIPTNGTISPDEDEYDLYVRVSYSCDTGYSLVGPSEAVCETGGIWYPSTSPTCESDCMKPSLTNGGVVPDQDTFSNGEVLSYKCNTNYTLVGVSTTTCRDGAFDPVTLPTCYSMCNPPIVYNSDYSTQRSPVDHASTITINCNSGYSTGMGTDKNLTCTDGEFNEEPPVCYANCHPMSLGIDNGVRTGDTTPFYHNEQVSYTCDNGYTLVGSSSITCNDGEWTDNEPVCEEVAEDIVVCDSTSMTVFLDRGFLSNGTNAEDVHLVNEDCVGIDYDSTRIALYTRYDMCSTTIEETETSIIYSNIVTYDTPRPITGTEITREDILKMPVQCELDRHRLLGDFFIPKTGEIWFNETGYGEFSLQMNRYTDGAFDELVRDDEGEVTLGEHLYFAVNLTSVTGLTVFIENCWATPSEHPNGAKSYYFLNNGCSEDPTMHMIYSSDPSFSQFAIDAFTFIDENPQVFIHCEVLVCNHDDPSSRCAKGCQTKLRRDSRRTRGTSSTPHLISNGPLSTFQKMHIAEKHNTDGWPAGFKSGILIGALAGVACLLVAVVAIILYMMSSRRMSQHGYHRVNIDENDL